MAADWTQYPSYNPLNGIMPDSFYLNPDSSIVSDGILGLWVAASGPLRSVNVPPAAPTYASVTDLEDVSGQLDPLALVNVDQWQIGNNRGYQVNCTDTGHRYLSNSTNGDFMRGNDVNFSWTFLVKVPAGGYADLDGIMMKTNVTEPALAANWTVGYGLHYQAGATKLNWWVDNPANGILFSPPIAGEYALIHVYYTYNGTDGTIGWRMKTSAGEDETSAIITVPLTLGLSAGLYSPLYVGRSVGAATRTMGAPFVMAMFMNRPLEGFEFSELAGNPFSLFRIKRGAVQYLTNPIDSRPFSMYIPENHDVDTGKLIVTCRGTHQTGNLVRDILDDQMGVTTDVGYNGGPSCMDVADERGCVYICPWMFFSAYGSPTSDAQAMGSYETIGGVASPNFQGDINAIINIITFLDGLETQEVPTGRLNRYTEGWSSGSDFAIILAILKASYFSKTMGCHAKLVTYTDPALALSDTTRVLNNLRNRIVTWTTPPNLPIQAVNTVVPPTGGGTDVASGESFDWRTDAEAKTVEIMIINGYDDSWVDIEAEKYRKYGDRAVLLYRQYGYRIWQRVYSGGGQNSDTCAVGMLNRPHSCHSRDHDVAAQFFYEGANSLLQSSSPKIGGKMPAIRGGNMNNL